MTTLKITTKETKKEKPKPHISEIVRDYKKQDAGELINCWLLD